MKGVAITAWVLVTLALAGCDDKPKVAQGVIAKSPQNPAPADQPKAFGNLGTNLDLWDLAHLVEVDHHGTFVDFGTPARAKYSLGDWRSGWGVDQTSGRDTFNYAVGTAGRLYVTLGAPAERVVRMRLKPIGTRVVTLYINGEPATAVRFKGEDWAEYDVQVPAAKWRKGSNRLLFRFGGTAPLKGQDVAVAMAWVHVMPKQAAKLPAKQISHPLFASMRTELDVGGVQRRALAVRPPTTLRYYLDVPEGARFGFGVGVSGADEKAKGKGVRARVEVTPEGGSTKSLFQGDVTGAWSDKVVSLAEFEGKVVRLDLTAEGKVGAGRVAWSTPALLVPRKQVAALSKPAKNVVVLLVDTLAAKKLKPYNSRSRIQTPVLDGIAREGTVFLAAQAPENWTKPSVASVLTSLWPATHGTKTDGAKLPQAATMLSEVYKEAGFATGSFIANGYVSDRFGFDQGWDHYTNYIREKKSTEAENVFKEAGDWIEEHKDERFFAYVQTIDPHVPYDPPEEVLKKYAKGSYEGQVSPRRTADLLADAKRNPPKVVFTDADKQRLADLHDAEISYHDKYLGLFVERLKKLEVYDDSIFVITSDHGEEFNEHGSWGHGHSVYQELLGVPFIVRWPTGVPAGKKVPQTVSTVSIFPTVLDATGVAVPKSAEGASLLNFMRGGEAPAPAVAFSDFLDDRRVIRAGRWKLILRGTNQTFFDLERDPGETKELASENHPLAFTYCSMLLGQFLGAKDLGNWMLAGESASKPARALEKENAQMDDTLREQLKQLGYAGDEPAVQTH